MADRALLIQHLVESAKGSLDLAVKAKGANVRFEQAVWDLATYDEVALPDTKTWKAFVKNLVREGHFDGRIRENLVSALVRPPKSGQKGVEDAEDRKIVNKWLDNVALIFRAKRIVPVLFAPRGGASAPSGGASASAQEATQEASQETEASESPSPVVSVPRSVMENLMATIDRAFANVSVTDPEEETVTLTQTITKTQFLQASKGAMSVEDATLSWQVLKDPELRDIAITPEFFPDVVLKEAVEGLAGVSHFHSQCYKCGVIVTTAEDIYEVLGWANCEAGCKKNFCDFCAEDGHDCEGATEGATLTEGPTLTEGSV